MMPSGFSELPSPTFAHRSFEAFLVSHFSFLEMQYHHLTISSQSCQQCADFLTPFVQFQQLKGQYPSKHESSQCSEEMHMHQASCQSSGNTVRNKLRQVHLYSLSLSISSEISLMKYFIRNLFLAKNLGVGKTFAQECKYFEILDTLLDSCSKPLGLGML